MSELYDKVVDPVSGGTYYVPKAQRALRCAECGNLLELEGSAPGDTLCTYCRTQKTYAPDERPQSEQLRLDANRERFRERAAEREESIPVFDTKTTETILDEAKRLVNGARNGNYGHPEDDFAALGRFWGAVLTRHFEGQGYGIHIPDLPAETVALMLACIKINRESARPMRDNLVDGAGYLFTVERIQRRREGLE